MPRSLSGGGPGLARLLNLGAIAVAEGDDASAEKAFREVLKASPESIAAWNSLGTIARKRGDFGEALRIFERALEFESKLEGGGRPAPPGRRSSPMPLDMALTRVSLGLLQARRGDFDAALDQIDKAVATYRSSFGPKHPKLADTLRRLGIVQLLAGQHDAARASLEEALQIKVAMAEDFVPVLSETESLEFLATLTERDPLLAALRDQEGTTETAYDAVW